MISTSVIILANIHWLDDIAIAGILIYTNRKRIKHIAQTKGVNTLRYLSKKIARKKP